MFAALNSFLTRAVTGYFLNKSLRFRSSASAYLSRTFGTPTSGTTWTWSGWVKLGSIGSAQYTLFGGDSTTSNYGLLDIGAVSANTLNFTNRPTGPSQDAVLNTTQVFRDPAAWYHIVAVWNTTSATTTVTGTPTDRLQLWVNGVQISSFSNTLVPAQNTVSVCNSAIAHELGAYVAAGGGYGGGFDGELAEINFVDGQALAPTSFGASSIYNQWLPKKYAGTYGTNGFYLPFTNTTSTSTLVADSSGNANNWTPNNISLTAGSTYDSLTDVPTLTSTTVANYAVLNPLDYSSSGTITLTNGNLTASGSGAAYGFYRATIQMSVKTYWEQINTLANPGDGIYAGIALSTGTVSGTGICYYTSSGNIYLNGSVSATIASYATNDVIGMAYDPATGNLTFYKNNASQATIVTGFGSNAFPICGDGSSNTETCNINFGQQPFTYTAPTGFLPLNTYNI